MLFLLVMLGMSLLIHIFISDMLDDFRKLASSLIHRLFRTKKAECFEQAKPESFFDSLRKNAKNNAIADKVTILAEKVKQIPAEKLEGSRLEHVREICCPRNGRC